MPFAVDGHIDGHEDDGPADNCFTGGDGCDPLSNAQGRRDGRVEHRSESDVGDNRDDRCGATFG